MPTIRAITVTTAAGRANALAQSQYEYLPFDARVEFSVISNGSANAQAFATVYSGTDVLQQRAEVDHETDKVPKYPDDFLLDDVAAAGERLSVELEFPGVAGSKVTTVAKITPL